MSKKCNFVIGFLLIIIVAGAYKFIFQGSVVESSDGRMAIQLNAAEKNMVLAEMRALLESTQKVTEGITKKDMSQVIKYARQVGMAAQSGVPGTLMGKLPMEFKILGSDTHKKFDQLALDAEDFGDSEHALLQLSALMQNCVSCHATYRISESGK